eukprot:CAMPEP_0180142154 /NCGR_PEP_ID=MMETSP0986-20121125/15404_1 /TAXON_ID=697907 /ORGANISM="non described non described, Strain CCMP2293" /LENGTH=88 /DNA_ID=CAMNT_0022085283 /DNA_START=173 /DNA_END=437 /DNA_ORIENTATION=-
MAMANDVDLEVTSPGGAYLMTEARNLRPTNEGHWRRADRWKVEGAGEVRPPHEVAHNLTRLRIQGYLDYKKTPPVGPYSRPMPRALWS